MGGTFARREVSKGTRSFGGVKVDLKKQGYALRSARPSGDHKPTGFFLLRLSPIQEILRFAQDDVGESRLEIRAEK
jgi:hypothetical protein